MNKLIKLVIVGSRTFNNYSLATAVINKIATEYGYKYIEIVSGGAKGTDAIGELYADSNGIPKKIFPADWKKWGKRAGFVRNVDIIDNCDVCICFWDGESHGTKHDIELCEQKHKPCHIYNFITNELIFSQNKE